MGADLALILLLLSCLAGILAEKPLTDDELDSCIDKYGINKQDLLDMDTGKLNHANAKDNEKCAILCIHQMLNIVDSSGKLMKDHIKAQFDRLDLRAPSEQILDDCSNMEGTNACDTAFLSVECLLDSSGEDLAALGIELAPKDNKSDKQMKEILPPRMEIAY